MKKILVLLCLAPTLCGQDCPVVYTEPVSPLPVYFTYDKGGSLGYSTGRGYIKAPRRLYPHRFQKISYVRK